MTQNYAVPGVYIEEQTGPGVIAGVGTSVAAFVGPALRGPLGEARRVTSYDEFLSLYAVTQPDGTLWPFIVNPNPFYLAHAVRGFFINGGSQAFILRVGTAATTQWAVNNQAAEPVFRINALEEGVGGNAIVIAVAADNATGAGGIAAVTGTAAVNIVDGLTVTVNNAAPFRAGDVVTEDETSRATIMQIDGNVLTLSNAITGLVAADTLRIGNIIPAQNSFRLPNTTGLWAGSVVLVGGDDAANPGTPVTDYGIVESVDRGANFVTLAPAPARANTYNMDPAAATPTVVTSQEFQLTITPPPASGAPAENFTDLSLSPLHPNYAIARALIQLAIGVFALIAGLLSGGTGTVAVLGTATALGIGAYMAVEEFQRYELQSAAYGAQLLSKDPSFVWVVVAVIGAGLDLAGVAAALRTLRPAVHAFNQTSDLAALETRLARLTQIDESIRANVLAAAGAEVRARAAWRSVLRPPAALRMVIIPGAEEFGRLVYAVYLTARRGIIGFERFVLSREAVSLVGDIAKLTPEQLTRFKGGYSQAVADVGQIASHGRTIGMTDEQIHALMQLRNNRPKMTVDDVVARMDDQRAAARTGAGEPPKTPRDLEEGTAPPEPTVRYEPPDPKGPGDIQVSPLHSLPESLEAAKQAGVPELIYGDAWVMSRADFADVLPDRPIPLGRPAPARRPTLGRTVSRSEIQNLEVRADLRLTQDALEGSGARIVDVRIDQTQVGATGGRAGTNRPDLQLTIMEAELSGRRIHIEYDRAPGTRALAHAERIIANDPDAIVVLKIVDFEPRVPRRRRR